MSANSVHPVTASQHVPTGCCARASGVGPRKERAGLAAGSPALMRLDGQSHPAALREQV
ncbi:MAG: hypothetical protein PVJ21_01415 [Anaerolineales bacterium]